MMTLDNVGFVALWLTWLAWFYISLTSCTTTYLALQPPPQTTWEQHSCLPSLEGSSLMPI